MNEKLEQKQRLLQEARDTLKILDNQRDECKLKINQLQIDVYSLTNGLQIGDKVQWQDGKEIKTGELSGWRQKYDSVEPIVTLHKKDGTLGLRTKDYWWQSQPVKVQTGIK